MIAVVKREFRSLLRSVRGLVFLGGYLLAAGVFITLFNFNTGSGTMEMALSYMVPVLILLLPILCVGMFGHEDESDPDRLLFLLPLRPMDIVCGKFFARLALMGLTTSIVCLYPLLFDLYGDVSYATVYLTILALFLVSAVILAFCTLLLVLLRNVRFALPVIYGALVLWYAIGILSAIVPISLVSKGMQTLSPFRSVDEFVFGLPDVRILLGYLLWTVLFLILAVVLYAKKKGRPHLLPALLCRMGRVTVSLCLVAVFLVAALLVALLPARISRADVTAEKSYTISEQTQKLLADLPHDVTIFVLDPSGNDVRFERFLDRLSDYSSRLSVETVDTAADPEFLSEYGLSGVTLSPYSLIIESERRFQAMDYTGLFRFSNATLGFSNITASELSQYEQVLASQSAEAYAYLQYDTVQYFHGDALISLLIEYVTAEKIPTAYLVEGLGTSLSDSIIAYCMSALGLGFSVWNPNESAAIPEDAASLVLCSPDRDLTDGERDAILSYLQGGGQLTLLTNESDLDKPNLMSVTATYGLTAQKGTLCELVTVENEDEKSTEVENEKTLETETVETEFLTLNPNFNHDVMAYMADSNGFSVVVSGANAITYPESTAGSLYIQPLLSTSPDAYVKGDPESTATYTVAVAADTAMGGRIAWFTGADSYLVAEDVTQTVNNASCIALAAAWTSWQYTSSLTQSPAPTPYTSMTLQMTSTDAMLMGALLILIVPAAAVSACVLLRYRRKKA